MCKKKIHVYIQIYAGHGKCFVPQSATCFPLYLSYLLCANYCLSTSSLFSILLICIFIYRYYLSIFFFSPRNFLFEDSLSISHNIVFVCMMKVVKDTELICTQLLLLMMMTFPHCNQRLVLLLNLY